MNNSKIKSLTIVSNQGVKQYSVGETYNGLLLDRINDQSVEFPDSITVIYTGFTAGGDFVFEAINTPMEIQYQPA